MSTVLQLRYPGLGETRKEQENRNLVLSVGCRLWGDMVSLVSGSQERKIHFFSPVDGKKGASTPPAYFALGWFVALGKEQGTNNNLTNWQALLTTEKGKESAALRVLFIQSHFSTSFSFPPLIDYFCFLYYHLPCLHILIHYLVCLMSLSGRLCILTHFSHTKIYRTF